MVHPVGPGNQDKGKKMSRIMLWAGAAALALGAAVAPVTADRHEDGRLTLLNELPKPKELVSKDGTLEGHKTPLEVVKKAINAAKNDKLDDLKACLAEDPRKNDADREHWGIGDEKGKTNLQVTAKLLAALDAEKSKQLEQGTKGNFAAVLVQKGDAVHLVRTVRQAPKEEKGEASKRKEYNWFLSSCDPGDYRLDFNTPQLKAFREAVTNADTAKFKEFIDESQTRVLDLLKDVQEGVDPYALLIKRLQTAMKNAERPTWLFGRWDTWGNVRVAFWFHGEKSDTFVVLRFRNEPDWETKTYSTKLQLDLDATAGFNRDAGNEFKNLINDWDW